MKLKFNLGSLFNYFFKANNYWAGENAVRGVIDKKEFWFSEIKDSFKKL